MSRNTVLDHHLPVQDTQGQLLDVALRLMQTGGYHAFSYADVAAEVGITKASVHYHYPAKADLGRAAVQTYRAGWQAELRALDTLPGGRDTAPGGRTRDAATRLRGYSRVYRDLLRGGRVCLALALAPESLRLPPDMQTELRGFYTEHEDWLTGVLEAGRAAGVVAVPGPLRVHAQALLSALHGAQALARVQGDVYRYCAVAHLTLSGLGLPFSELEISDPAAFEVQNTEAREADTAPSAPGLAESGLAESGLATPGLALV